jgi:alcohol dehydrogenase class IV
MLRALQTKAHLNPFASTITKPLATSFTQSRPTSSSSKMESSLQPLQGLYKPNNLKALYYGPDVVKKHILSCLPTESSKAFIITGSSLATKTPLIKDLEQLLSSKHHAGTFSNIKEHAPIAQLDQATSKVKEDSLIDTIISVGGGSPIDSAKAIIYRVNETSQKWLTHITIPTTLSAAECTFFAGYTQEDGTKTGIGHPNTFPSYIFYDSKFGLHSPPNLLLSTGFRAMDHAVESQYHPTTTYIPCRMIALSAIGELFRLLPKYKENPRDEDTITGLFLAAYASLAFLGQNVKGGLGLSHSLGYALGSPYGIPHGVTSCLTLGHVVKLKARQSTENAANIANILPYIGGMRSGDDVKDADEVGDKILKLVEDLGQKTTLTEKGVSKDQSDIICERATGGLTRERAKEQGAESQEMLGGVRNLVERLW